jgi:hypothetical protein
MKEKNIRELLIDWYKSGEFLLQIGTQYHHDKNEQKVFIDEIVSLQNEQIIDLIKEFKKLKSSDQSRDFFLCRRIFEESLPYIKAPINDVMECVKHLTLEAGTDMMAGSLISPFIKYIKENKYADDVLSIGLDNVDEAFDFIMPGLVAGAEIDLSNYLQKAIELTTNSNFIVKKRAIKALGRINYHDNKQFKQKVFDAIETIVYSIDNIDLHNEAVQSSVLLNIFDLEDISCVQKLFEYILRSKDDLILHTLSDRLFYYPDYIPDEIAKICLSALKKVNPKHQGTINNIDLILQNILAKKDIDTVIDFLESYLVNNQREMVSIKSFQSILHNILEDKELRNKLTTRWFLSKKIILCRGVLDLVYETMDSKVTLSIDISEARQESNVKIYSFLAKKACGWLFLHPVSAVSFIISLIDYANEDEVNEIKDILFNPLLMSYSGEAREYLNSIINESSDAVKKVIMALNSQLDEYHQNLQSANDIAELHPSQSQKESYYRYNTKLMDSAQKNVPKGIFQQLFKTSVLLYGNRSIHYVYHGLNGEKSRQEVPLQRISHSIELPSLETLDPHGLDKQLRNFKIEGCRL